MFLKKVDKKYLVILLLSIFILNGISTNAYADSVQPNDPYYESGHMWGLDIINMPGAWRFSKGNKNIIVGIAGLSVNASHPDLSGNIVSSVDGHEASLIKGSVTIKNNEDFGTHAAGIIGAVGDNGIGVPGINWKISILPGPVATNQANNQANNSVSTIEKNLEFFLNRKQEGENIKVLLFCYNFWLEQNEFESSEFKRVNELLLELSKSGVLIVVPSGDDGQDIENPTAEFEGKKLWPVENPLRDKQKMLVVGGCGQAGSFYTGSNFSTLKVDICAPGVGIWSTVSNADYESLDGTLAAAAHVAGVASLFYSGYPEIPVKETIDIIRGIVTPYTALTEKCRSGGIPDAEKILESGGKYTSVSGISFLEKEMEIHVGEEHQMEYNISPEDATNKQTTFKVSNNAYLSIDEKGVVKGKQPGEAVITIKTVDGGFEDMCTVSITNSPNPSPGPDPDPEPNPIPPVLDGSGCSTAKGTAISLFFFTPLVFLSVQKKAKENFEQGAKE